MLTLPNRLESFKCSDNVTGNPSARKHRIESIDICNEGDGDGIASSWCSNSRSYGEACEDDVALFVPARGDRLVDANVVVILGKLWADEGAQILLEGNMELLIRDGTSLVDCLLHLTEGDG